MSSKESFMHTVFSSNFLAVLGTLAAVYYAFSLFSFVKLHILHRSTLPRYLSGTDGKQSSWALVTGASDGIGKGLAYELAERGFEVVLHGRNPAKLNGVREALAKSYPARKFEVLIIDASESHADVGKAVELAKKLPGKLRVLVNNCGGAHMLPNTYSLLNEHTPTDVDGMVNLNAVFPTQLTRALLPVLAANKPSLIINCGSVAGIITVPYLSVYAGTKGYINSWGNALTREMKAQNVDIEVLTITIGAVNETQGMTGKATLFAPPPRAEARAILDKVGCGEETVVAHWAHALQVGVFGMFPRDLVAKIIVSIGKQRRDESLKGK